MKRTIIVGVVVSAIGLVNPRTVQAQGTITYLSNLGQTSAGSIAVGSDSWLAAMFRTGGNTGGYTLNSVQLAMTDATGGSNGFIVMVYSFKSSLGANVPGSSLGTLTDSIDPATGGTYTYDSASSLILSPGTDYFIVITAGTTVANGAYEWSLSGINSYNPTGGWAVTAPDADVWKSNGGSSWNSLSGTNPQFAINATAAPEPGVIGLFALGGLLVAFQRRKATPV
jgi:hypothetical protein